MSEQTQKEKDVAAVVARHVVMPTPNLGLQ